MFKYTFAAYHKIVDDLKRLTFLVTVSLHLLYISYFIFAICTNAGFLAVNITLLVITAAYLCFYLITKGRYDDKSSNAKGKVTKIYKAIKFAVVTVNLAITIYTVCVTVENITLPSLVLTALMVIGWIFQVILSLAFAFVKTEFELLIDGIEADFEFAYNAKVTVSNVFKRIKGEEIEERKEIISDKNREILKKQAAKDKESKKQMSNSSFSLKNLFKNIVTGQESDDRTEDETCKK
jgi:hypothetical protein